MDGSCLYSGLVLGLKGWGWGFRDRIEGAKKKEILRRRTCESSELVQMRCEGGFGSFWLTDLGMRPGEKGERKKRES